MEGILIADKLPGNLAGNPDGGRDWCKSLAYDAAFSFWRKKNGFQVRGTYVPLEPPVWIASRLRGGNEAST